jgi:hypothetical protein
MKLLVNIAPMLLLIFACKMCGSTGKTLTASELNPYRGTLEELVPKEKSLGLIKFKQTTLRHITFPGAQDAVDTAYEQSAGSIVVGAQLKVVNFTSSQSAEAAIQLAANEKAAVLQTKTKSGRSVGQRFTAQNGQAVVWTNGSLLCIAYSQFAKTTSNLEDVLPF